MELPAQTRKGAQRVACVLLLVALAYVFHDQVFAATGYAYGPGGGPYGHRNGVAERHWASTGRWGAGAGSPPANAAWATQPRGQGQPSGYNARQTYLQGRFQGRFGPRQGRYDEGYGLQQGPPQGWNSRYAGRPMFE